MHGSRLLWSLVPSFSANVIDMSSMVLVLFLLLAYITSNPDAAEEEEELLLTGLIHRSYLIEIVRKSALEWFTAFSDLTPGVPRVDAT